MRDMSVCIERRRAAVLHDKVTPDSPADEQDNLRQASEIATALEHLGFTVQSVALSCDLSRSLSALRETRPNVVFNLVESIEGDGRLAYAATALLEVEGLPFTGAGTRGLLCSGDKRIAKRLFAAAGVPTPEYACNGTSVEHWGDDTVGIVKPACEDASIGIDAQSVVRGGRRLSAELEARRRRFGGPWFVERYIDGREFNVALLASHDGVEVLPISEIYFVDYPSGRPRIVDYEAKWDPGSRAYLHTPRRMISPNDERALCDELARIALDCHRILDLGAYARIDFRVDADGQPFVLEANANPCLTSDAGFVAAAAQAGISFDQVVERIVDASRIVHSRSAPVGRVASASGMLVNDCRLSAAN